MWAFVSRQRKRPDAVKRRAVGFTSWPHHEGKATVMPLILPAFECFHKTSLHWRGIGFSRELTTWGNARPAACGSNAVLT